MARNNNESKTTKSRAVERLNTINKKPQTVEELRKKVAPKERILTDTDYTPRKKDISPSIDITKKCEAELKRSKTSEFAIENLTEALIKVLGQGRGTGNINNSKGVSRKVEAEVKTEDKQTKE